MNINKKILITILKCTTLSIITISFLLFLIKSSANNKKLTIIISKILSIPIYKKDKKLINELLDLIIKIYKIRELNIITENNEFFRGKKNNNIKLHNISEDIIYKKRIVGFLKISFKK
jgi:hypothetical protein